MSHSKHFLFYWYSFRCCVNGPRWCCQLNRRSAYEYRKWNRGKLIIRWITRNRFAYLYSRQLKAFYVDFILPLENNIEKDTKVIQIEQKKFVQLHKQRIESFNKATSAMKKHRKKKNNAEKELKVRLLYNWIELHNRSKCFRSAFKLWRKRRSFSTTFAIRVSKVLWYRSEEGLFNFL